MRSQPHECHDKEIDKVERDKNSHDSLAALSWMALKSTIMFSGKIEAHCLLTSLTMIERVGGRLYVVPSQG